MPQKKSERTLHTRYIMCLSFIINCYKYLLYKTCKKRINKLSKAKKAQWFTNWFWKTIKKDDISKKIEEELFDDYRKNSYLEIIRKKNVIIINLKSTKGALLNNRYNKIFLQPKIEYYKEEDKNPVNGTWKFTGSGSTWTVPLNTDLSKYEVHIIDTPKTFVLDVVTGVPINYIKGHTDITTPQAEHLSPTRTRILPAPKRSS